MPLDNFEELSNRALQALSSASASSQFLGTRDLLFYKSSCPEFSKLLDNAGEKILGLCTQLLSRGNKSIRPLEELDDVVDRYDEVVDAVDVFLEKADICLDDALGKKKTVGVGNTPVQSAPVVVKIKSAVGSQRENDYQVVHAQNITRPQLLFEDKIDNSNTPFVRKLGFKDNAMRPLDEGMPSSGQISPDMVQHIKTLGITDVNSSQYTLPHPYHYEINNIPYPSDMFDIRPEILYKPLDDKSFVWVDSEEGLQDLMNDLSCAKEIAVDIEHHDYRSFQGFCCLLQISTRDQDYLIDTLALRSHLYQLNKYFSDPKILKVFHGAEMDIVWLQRDFGVYVVNLFDTYHASHVLELPSHGLAYLLKYYCNVETNKKFQTADWRIRPLTKDMLKYARMDTHYLLYIYDRMRNEALSRSDPVTKQSLHVILRRSEQTSLNLYEKEFYDADNGEGPNGWRSNLRKYPYPLNAEQTAVFKAIHAWRDHIARAEDESVRYILPTHMLMNLAKEIPKSVPEILSCCNPVPNVVRLYSSDILLLIEKAVQDAKEVIANKNKEAFRQFPELESKEREREKRKTDGPLHIRFDDQDDNTNKHTIEPLPPNFFSMSLTEGKSGSKKALRSAIVTIRQAPSYFGPDEGYASSVDIHDLAHAEDVRKSLVLKAPGFDLIRKRKIEETSEAPATSAPTKVDKKPSFKSAIAEINPKRKKMKHVEPTAESSSSVDVEMADLPPLDSKFKYPDASELLKDSPEKKDTKKFNPRAEVDESHISTIGRKAPPSASRHNRTKTMSYK
ncbi:Exosome component 10 [Phlyctochytrium planicorne]|nr:Exosome component 10 [Phlyctochytrium planicorne]